MEEDLTILIPALNEEKTIGIVIEKAEKWIEKNNVKAEILVVNNGSTDNTKNIAIQKGAKVIYVQERGYGIALINGIKASKGKYIIMGDADDSYNFLEIDNIYKSLVEEGYELIIGNRFFNMEKGAMKLTHKYIGTPLLSYIIRKKYKLNIKDVNCGLRGFEKEKIINIDLKCKGMEFASEMIIKAKLNNLKIKEVPINFYKDKRGRNSHLNTIKDGIKHIEVILKCRNR